MKGKDKTAMFPAEHFCSKQAFNIGCPTLRMHEIYIIIPDNPCQSTHCPEVVPMPFVQTDQFPRSTILAYPGLIRLIKAADDISDMGRGITTKIINNSLGSTNGVSVDKVQYGYASGLWHA
jgi:hypothetical protein